jgi:hypothetical protein
LGKLKGLKCSLRKTIFASDKLFVFDFKYLAYEKRLMIYKKGKVFTGKYTFLSEISSVFWDKREIYIMLVERVFWNF